MTGPLEAAAIMSSTGQAEFCVQAACTYESRRVDLLVEA